jgi:parvulin-like peptidyl-prolyl isomerase
MAFHSPAIAAFWLFASFDGQALSPKIRAAVAKLSKDALSPIIEEPGYFILISVGDRRTPPPPPFEKVKEQVTNRLKNDLANEHIEKTLVRLRAAADIQRLEPPPSATNAQP